MRLIKPSIATAGAKELETVKLIEVNRDHDSLALESMNQRLTVIKSRRRLRALMNRQHDNLFASTATNERALLAHSFAVYAGPISDRGPYTSLCDHGLAWPEAGDLMT